MKSNRSWMFGVLILFAGAACLSMVSQAPAGERGKGRRSVAGTVTNVNTDDRRISLEIGTTKTPNTQTYNIAQDAKIIVKGRTATLSDVKRGMHATLALKRESNLVVKIRAHEAGR